MVGRRVDGVGSDGVGAELLEKGDVSSAGGWVREGVGEFGVLDTGAGGPGILLVGNALDVELRSVLVEEFGALEGGSGMSLGLSRDRGNMNWGLPYLDHDWLKSSYGGSQQGRHECLGERHGRSG